MPRLNLFYATLPFGLVEPAPFKLAPPGNHFHIVSPTSTHAWKLGAKPSLSGLHFVRERWLIAQGRFRGLVIEISQVRPSLVR